MQVFLKETINSATLTVILCKNMKITPILDLCLDTDKQ